MADDRLYAMWVLLLTTGVRRAEAVSTHQPKTRRGRRNVAPLHPDTITATFKSIIRNLDVPQIRLHDPRHTSATLALKAAIHPKVVSERLGHATANSPADGQWSWASAAIRGSWANRASPSGSTSHRLATVWHHGGPAYRSGRPTLIRRARGG